MDIREHITGAVHKCYWRDDINCARTMLTILAGLGGQAVNPQVLTAAVGLHGAGGYGAQCGLVEGGLMYVGIAGDACGLTEEETVSLCKDFAAAFTAAFGSLLCRQLRPEGFSPDNPPHLCEKLTVEAVTFAAEYMRGKGLSSAGGGR